MCRRRRGKRLIIFLVFGLLVLGIKLQFLQEQPVLPIGDVQEREFVPDGVNASFGDQCSLSAPGWSFGGSAGLAVLTSRSPLAFQAVSRAIRSHLNVLVIAERAALERGAFPSLLAEVRPSRDKLRSLTIGQCSINNLRHSIRMTRVRQLYVVFEEADFAEPVSAKRIGQILACLVSLLEMIAHNSTFNLTVHLHVKYDKHGGMTPYTCLEKLDGSRFQDVLLKSVYLYVTTYKQLYNLPIQLFVS